MRDLVQITGAAMGVGAASSAEVNADEGASVVKHNLDPGAFSLDIFQASFAVPTKGAEFQFAHFVESEYLRESRRVCAVSSKSGDAAEGSTYPDPVILDSSLYLPRTQQEFECVKDLHLHRFCQRLNRASTRNCRMPMESVFRLEVNHSGRPGQTDLNTQPIQSDEWGEGREIFGRQRLAWVKHLGSYSIRSDQSPTPKRVRVAVSSSRAAEDRLITVCQKSK